MTRDIEWSAKCEAEIIIILKRWRGKACGVGEEIIGFKCVISVEFVRVAMELAGS
jgi:hypothetical protein